MKFFFKFLVTTLGLVLIGVALVALFMATQLESNLKGGIERSLNYIYQAPVRVDAVHVILSQGALDLEGLTIFNPEPFKKGPAVEVGHVHVEFVPKTLLSRTPTIRNVTLQDARIHLRLEAGRGTNLGRLDENATRLVEGKTSGAPATARRTFIVQEFRSDDARVEFSSNLLPVSSVGLDVQPFTMSELSSETPVSTIDVCILFIRNVLKEGLSVRGVLGPVADKLRAELDRITEPDRQPSEPSTDAPQPVQ